jgi:transposase-like protein
MLHPSSLLFPSLAAKGTSLRVFLALAPASNGDATDKVHCPACASASVRRSARRGLRERLASVLAIYPYQCNECNRRFTARARLRK